MPDSVIHSTPSRHCGMEIQGENHTPARSLLYSVRIGYATQSHRKPASPCRRVVAGPRLLQPLSAALSAKIRIRRADINLLSVTRSDSAALLDGLKSAGVPAVEIGGVLPQGKTLIGVV